MELLCHALLTLRGQSWPNLYFTIYLGSVQVEMNIHMIYTKAKGTIKIREQIICPNFDFKIII